MSQQNRLKGPTSAFESPSKSPPPSAVSSLASRFDTPPSTSDAPQVSHKLSGIASRFGTTIADVAAAKAPRSRNRTPIKPSAPATNEQRSINPVIEERPDFGAIAKRFASGDAGRVHFDKEEEQNTFASARSAFSKIDDAAKQPVEGRVSAAARGFETGNMVRQPQRKPVVLEEEKESGQNKIAVDKAGSVGSITSRFEAVKVVGKDESNGEKEPTLADKFENAARIFGKHQKEEEKEADRGDSTIAGTSKVFGGSHGNS